MRFSLIAASISLLALAVSVRANAETFDCRHPALPLARIVCGDPVLRAADAEENGIYATATSASLDRASLRAEESAWFAAEILPYNWFAQQNMPISNGEIVDAYRQREAALRQETQAWRKLRRGVPGAALFASCLALPYPSNGGCSVAAYAPIEGAAALRYQLQTYSQPTAHDAVVIFAAPQDQPDTWMPLAVTMSKDAKLGVPQAAASPFGTLLTIASGGSGNHGDGSALYRLTPDALEDIDDRSWLETLAAHLPDGLALSPEIVADYGKMQAVTTVSHSQSTCCAVGSTAMINLAIENQRVVVAGVTFSASEEATNNNAN